MPYNEYYVDDRLVEWGDELFEPPLKNTRKTNQDKQLWLLAYVAWSSVERERRGQLIREQITRTIKRAPEVMVKITSKKGAGQGMLAIINHLSYISRNGKLELETDQGEILDGKGDLKAFLIDWQTGSNGSAISNEGVTGKRDAINIMFSMPAGTPAKEVKDSVRAVLEEEIGGKFSYVFALHEDTDHAHVHVCIKRTPIARGPLFALRKNDLARWRERFATHLRERGIEANATPRRTRGVTKDPIALDLYHLSQAGRAKSATKPALAMSDPASAPQLFARERSAWDGLRASLQSSITPADQLLANAVESFKRQMFKVPDVKVSRQIELSTNKTELENKTIKRKL